MSDQFKARLAVDETQLDPAYHYRWINDDPGRINRMTADEGYDVVKNPDGSPVSHAVGTGMKEGVMAYLCCKKKERHDADQGKRQEDLDALLKPMSDEAMNKHEDMRARRRRFIHDDKSFSDLPEDAQVACNKFTADGIMTKEAYVREYFTEEYFANE